MIGNNHIANPVTGSISNRQQPIQMHSQQLVLGQIQGNSASTSNLIHIPRSQLGKSPKFVNVRDHQHRPDQQSPMPSSNLLLQHSLIPRPSNVIGGHRNISITNITQRNSMSPANGGGNITAIDITRDVSPYRAQALNMSPTRNEIAQKDSKNSTGSQQSLMRSTSGIMQFKNAIASIQQNLQKQQNQVRLQNESTVAPLRIPLQKHEESTLLKQIDKLKLDNKSLQATVKQLELSKQVAYETSEQEVTQRFSNSIYNSLKRLGLMQGQLNQDVNFLHCKNLRDLIVTVDNFLHLKSASNDYYQRQQSLPELIEDGPNNSNVKSENQILKLQIAKMENKINHIELEFKRCIYQGYKINGELSELKALKKSITQYFTSQNSQSWRSTQMPLDSQLKHNNVSNNNNSVPQPHFSVLEEAQPSPSFLRIMVSEQIIEEENSCSSAGGGYENIGFRKQSVSALKIHHPQSESYFREDNLSPRTMGRGVKISPFKNHIALHQQDENFTLPDIQGNVDFQNKSRQPSLSKVEKSGLLVTPTVPMYQQRYGGMQNSGSKISVSQLLASTELLEQGSSRKHHQFYQQLQQEE